MSVPLLVNLQQKVGELVLSITSCPRINFRKYVKLLYRKNVVTMSLTTGIMSPLFTCMLFWMWEFYEDGPRVRRALKNWYAITESLRNTAGMYVCMRALELNCCLHLLFLYFQCIMDFTQAGFVLLLSMREVRLKKKYWVHPTVTDF
jgi:hypothetical protein